MLLEFKMRNFRSFYKEAVLSMIASARQQKHVERLIPYRDAHVLPMAVIYGANASGKTSVVMGLDLLRTAVMSGTVRAAPGNTLLSVAELLPFIHSHDRLSEPIGLEVAFVYKDLAFNYELAFSTFLKQAEEPGKRAITSESLRVNSIPLFDRTSARGVRIFTSNGALRFYKDSPSPPFLKKLEQQINDNIDTEDLFLSNAFKNVVNHPVAQMVQKWFEHTLHPLWNFDETTAMPVLPDRLPQGRLVLRNKLMEALLRHADFGPQEVAYVVDNDEQGSSKPSLRSRYRVGGGQKEYSLDLPAEILESKGTLRILQFALPFIGALRDGLVLVVDELDASIHPEIIAGFIRVFNNRELNKRGAQLLLTTHNPVYLDNNLLRRDQVVFVSRDRETYESELYTLADFKTTGSSGVRADEHYLRNYLSGKYGALPFVDLEGAIRTALAAAEESE